MRGGSKNSRVAWLLAAVILWQVYAWLSTAVGDVRRATTNERLMGRMLFLGALGVTIPVVPLL